MANWKQYALYSVDSYGMYKMPAFSCYTLNKSYVWQAHIFKTASFNETDILVDPSLKSLAGYFHDMTAQSHNDLCGLSGFNT